MNICRIYQISSILVSVATQETTWNSLSHKTLWLAQIKIRSSGGSWSQMSTHYAKSSQTGGKMLNWFPTLRYQDLHTLKQLTHFCMINKHHQPCNPSLYTLGDDKMSMLTHTYPHKPLRNIKMTICNHQTDSPLHVWPHVWSGDLQVYKSMVIHDTECPCWDLVSLNNTIPTLPFICCGIINNEQQHSIENIPLSCQNITYV